MHIVSVINYKGGVGKTSLTVNLAAELAFRGKKILLVDLDAQASLTFSLISPDQWREHYEATKTIKSWFDSFEHGQPISLKTIVQHPARINKRLGQAGGAINAIYSHLGLINVDLELASNLGGATLAKAKKNFTRIHRRMADGLAAFSDDGYDLVLIDCPPNFNIVTKTAIIASDSLFGTEDSEPRSCPPEERHQQERISKQTKGERGDLGPKRPTAVIKAQNVVDMMKYAQYNG